MRMRRFTFILSFGLFCFSLAGCQEGKKKDSPALVYQTGMAKCDQLSSRLKGLNISIEGAPIETSEEEAALPDSARSGQALVQAQAWLEEYLTTSRQLLDIGDTKVVVFPEKGRVEIGAGRAARYLGQLYAELNWGPQAKTSVQSREVDWAELGVRQKRVAVVLSALATAGLVLDQEKELARVPDQLKKIETRRLEPMEKWFEPAQIDALRAAALWKRNENFQVVSGGSAMHAMEELARLFEVVEGGVQKEIVVRASMTLEKPRPVKR